MAICGARDIGAELDKPEFVAGLRLLARYGLSLDTANPDPALIGNMVRVADKAPDLRLVIDHLPQLDPPQEKEALARYEGHVRELAARPNVYVKISQVLRHVDGRVPEDLSFYRSRIDAVFGLFGEDRVMYGSDWPNSDQWGPYPLVLKLVREYFEGKAPGVAEKYFWRNSKAAYRWGKREASQPGE